MTLGLMIALGAAAMLFGLFVLQSDTDRIEERIAKGEKLPTEDRGFEVIDRE